MVFWFILMDWMGVGCRDKGKTSICMVYSFSDYVILLMQVGDWGDHRFRAPIGG